MRSLIRIIPVLAVALLIFALPALAGDGMNFEIGHQGGFVCYPFICG